MSYAVHIYMYLYAFRDLIRTHTLQFSAQLVDVTWRHSFFCYSMVLLMRLSQILAVRNPRLTHTTTSAMRAAEQADVVVQTIR